MPNLVSRRQTSPPTSPSSPHLFKYIRNNIVHPSAQIIGLPGCNDCDAFPRIRPGMALANIWHSRRVAEASARPCDICYKATTTVLITPDNRDHFYVCITHLKDKGFASPIIDPAEAAEKKKKEELDREIEIIKKEFDERMAKKAKNKKDKKEDSKTQDVKDGKKDPEEDAKAMKERDDKVSLERSPPIHEYDTHSL